MRSVMSVVITLLIIVLCGGLFTQAISQIRNAAVRGECQNNLKQISLSVISFADGHRGRFPAAYSAEQPKVPHKQRFGWLAAVEPYTEGRMDPPFANLEYGWDAPENRDYIRIQPVWCLCPSNLTRGAAGTPGLTHYVGIAGVGKDAIDLPEGDPGAGFFGRSRTLKLEDLTRGASTTLMVMETMRDNGPWAAPGYATVRGLDSNDPAYLGPEGQFSSNHRGTTTFSWTVFPVSNAAFGDGSVRPISGRISPGVLESLATLAGSQNADPDDGF
jgi:hypothetical protein